MPNSGIGRFSALPFWCRRKLRWIGLGHSYFWGDHFSGWSEGLDMQFQF